ncbi:MAG: T9SS type A sorting domain-containing protein, partial [Bacteroidota bacterium]
PSALTATSHAIRADFAGYGDYLTSSSNPAGNKTLTINPLPSTAGTISGTASVCKGTTGVTYSVSSITNATGYVWSLPSGATIATGNNTNSITVDFSSTASSGNITVYGTNGCGNGTVSSDYGVTLTGNQWIGGGSGNWESAANWCGGLPISSSDVEIPAGTTVHVTSLPNANAVCHNLTIDAGGYVVIDAGKALTVTGITTTNDGLTIKSPSNTGASGSLITLGTVSGNSIVERYIPAYTGPNDGWHLVVSPVNNAPIGNFSPGANDDFYRYIESTNIWNNWKVNNFDFTNGQGYLCAYQVSVVKSFTGTPNNADIPSSNLSLTGTRGWHMLGNPFPCALTWNDGNWGLSNVVATAKTMNTGGTYSDLVANDIIPSMQGFFVQVTDASNSVTIPKASRVHDAAIWNKQTFVDRLLLTASSNDNPTYVESVVRFDPMSTPSFDNTFDAHFLPGISNAPQLFSMIDGNELLSTNTLPTSSGNTLVTLGFTKGVAGNYSLAFDGISTFPANCTIILEDLKTSVTQDLKLNPAYPFVSADGDNQVRFKLHFNGLLGIGILPSSESKIYAHQGTLYIDNHDNQFSNGQIEVYNISGIKITTAKLNGDLLQKFILNAIPGCYIVKLTTNKVVYSKKLIF